MSARIKGLFTKKKDDRAKHVKEVFASSSARTSSSSFGMGSTRPQSIGSFTSSASAVEVSSGVLPAKTETIQRPQKQQQQQQQAPSSASSVSILSSPSHSRPMTVDTVVQDLGISTTVVSPPSPPASTSKGRDSLPMTNPNGAVAEKEKATVSLKNLSIPKEFTPVANNTPSHHLSLNATQTHNASQDGGLSVHSAQFDDQEPQEHELSFVEQMSYRSASPVEQEMDPNGVQYVNSTAEYFHPDNHEEQDYMDHYPEENDEFPILQSNVYKLQKQVREMRKFMRGLVQLQVEQYEPATILIQAWWRGCLVRRDLRKQRVLSWHTNPRRSVKKVKYLTKADLYQSCERISSPRAALLVTADLGAEKETSAAVKLQAIFRSYLVRKRVRAYRDGNHAATIIQARWRGYKTRNIDTRLAVEQLRFRNLKIQKAFGRVSIKLQYLQGRILALEENSVPMHEAQELIHKDIEDMADQIDALRQDLDQGLKQLDEQVSEEREQTTIELRTLTERIQKLEEDLTTVRAANTKVEKQVKALTFDQDEEEDEDYEVEYDEDGNRIERPPPIRRGTNASLHDQGAGSRRTSNVHPHQVLDSSMGMVDSPIPMHQQAQHRGSIGSVHSQSNTRPRSMSSQPSSPTQNFPRAFPASYSPTMASSAAVVVPDGVSANGTFHNAGRPHSISVPAMYHHSQQGSHNNVTRPLNMDPNQLYRFHTSANQYIPVSPSSAGSAFPTPEQAKKYVSVDDFEYMQAEVDTLRLNNDRLEGMVRELTMRLNGMMSNPGQFYPG